VAEVALAATLLVGAGLLVRTFINLVRADRGLDTTGVITGWISLPEFSFAGRAARYVFADSLDAQLRALPGIAEVALSYGAPPTGGEIHFGRMRSDVPGGAPVDREVNVYSVGEDFFRLYRIRLLEGRLFKQGDANTDVVIGEALAKQLWPGVSPVGRTFSFEGDKSSLRVLGVVNETSSPLLDPRRDSPEMYRPLWVVTDGVLEPRVLGGGQIHFSVRCQSACPGLDLIRRQVRRVSSRAVIYSLGALEAAYLEELAGPRAAAALAATFAVTATLAAAGGLFSVLSYAVGRRRREFGIRAAMGAAPSQLRRIVLGSGLRVAGVGLAIGAAAAWALSRSLASLQYGVTVGDWMTWLAVFGVIGVTAVAAAWRPASDAASVDPVKLLREQ
jgi:hypothetical protein